MKTNELLINSSELHLITGLHIDECREIFRENYLPNKTDFDTLMRYKPDLDLYNRYKIFKNNWFRYRDNKDYILNDPFKEDGEFKVGRKIKFLLNHLCEEHVEEIKNNWEQKKAILKSQMSISS